MQGVARFYCSGLSGLWNSLIANGNSHGTLPLWVQLEFLELVSSPLPWFLTKWDFPLEGKPNHRY